MKKYTLLSFLFTAVFILNSRAQSNGLAKLIATERNFASTSVNKNTKVAFLSFMADSGLIFRNGQAINAKARWNSKQADSSVLWWQPEFAALAEDGKLGFTSGPWSYKVNKLDSVPVAYGHFFTVWQMQSDNEFKAIVDIGISNAAVEVKENGQVQSADIISIKKKPGTDSEFKTIISLEESFISAYKKNGGKVYDLYKAKESKYYRTGELPFTNTDSLKNFIAKNKEKIAFEKLKGNIARSGDWGYMYGNVTLEITDQKGKRELKGNYLHVWRKNKSGNWKLIAEVVSI